MISLVQSYHRLLGMIYNLLQGQKIQKSHISYFFQTNTDVLDITSFTTNVA